MIGPGQGGEQVGFTIREVPAFVKASRGELVQRAVASSNFFSKEQNRTLYADRLTDSHSHYRTKRPAANNFLFNDFLGVKDGDRVVLTKDLNSEGYPNYGYSSEDLSKSVEIKYRSNGGYELVFHEFDKTGYYDNAERVTNVIFTKDSKIASIHDSMLVHNRNLVNRYENHGVRYGITRMGEGYDVRMIDTIDEESEQDSIPAWQHDEEYPDVSKPETLKPADRYLFQNLPPDSSLTAIPLELFKDSRTK